MQIAARQRRLAEEFPATRPAVTREKLNEGGLTWTCVLELLSVVTFESFVGGGWIEVALTATDMSS